MNVPKEVQWSLEYLSKGFYVHDDRLHRLFPQLKWQKHFAFSIVQFSLSDARMDRYQSDEIARRTSVFKSWPLLDKWMWAKVMVCTKIYHFHRNGTCCYFLLLSKRSKDYGKLGFHNKSSMCFSSYTWIWIMMREVILKRKKWTILLWNNNEGNTQEYF